MQSVPKNETFKEHRANSESQGPGLALNFQLKCKLSESCSVVSDSVILVTVPQPSLLCPWASSGKNIRVGSHFFLQGSSPPRD